MSKPARRTLHIKYLVAAMGAGTGAIICVLFAVIVWMLHVSSANLDRADTRGEATLLRSLTIDYRKTLSSGVADYSAWTELFRYLQGPRNAAWEKENLGPYITDTFGTDAMLIVSRKGRIVYSYSRDRRSPLLARALRDTAAIGSLVRLAFAVEKPGVQMPAAGFLALNGIPILAAAATIRDSDARSHSFYALIEIRILTPAAFEKLGRQYDVAGLRPARTAAGIALKTPQGTLAPFHLIWDPADTGYEMFLRMLPVVLAASVVAFLALLAIAYIGNRILARLRRGEQRLLKAELHSSHARAQAAEDLARSKSAFIANMSHELRTPLNAIIGFSDMMRTETFGPVTVPKYREYLDAIHASGGHLLNVVNDILNLSKIEAGKLELALQPIHLEGAIREAAGLIEPLAQKRGIGLVTWIGCREVVADRQALQQVLLNLLSNAIKFSPEGATVEICARETDSVCEIAVTDHGCGMAEEMLENLGKPFVQAEGAYSRTHQGTGLGLAISFMLTRGMNGKIAVTSAEGAGTTVTVTLPKACSAAEPQRRKILVA